MPAGIDHGTGSELVVRRIITDKDPAIEQARAAGLQVLEGRYAVRKYRGADVTPDALYEVVETGPNLFLTAGIAEVLRLAAGQSATAYNATNARLCVGNSGTAPVAGNTNLAGVSTFRQVVDAAPVIAGNQITFVATFAQANANFAWNEIGVANHASAGQMWSRSTPAGGLGTKTSAATWVLNWTLSIS